MIEREIVILVITWSGSDGDTHIDTNTSKWNQRLGYQWPPRVHSHGEARPPGECYFKEEKEGGKAARKCRSWMVREFHSTGGLIDVRCFRSRLPRRAGETDPRAAHPSGQASGLRTFAATRVCCTFGRPAWHVPHTLGVDVGLQF